MSLGDAAGEREGWVSEGKAVEPLLPGVEYKGHKMSKERAEILSTRRGSGPNFKVDF